MSEFKKNTDSDDQELIDKKLLRKNKTKNLKANLTKSKKILKYKVKTNIKELIKIMMESEIKKYNG